MVSWMKVPWLTARKQIKELEQEVEKLRRENEELRRDRERLEKDKDRLRQERDQLKEKLVQMLSEMNREYLKRVFEQVRRQFPVRIEPVPEVRLHVESATLAVVE